MTPVAAMLDDVRSGCESLGLRVEAIRPLEGGYQGGNFLATSPDGKLVVKLRPRLQPLAVARTASHLMCRRGLPHSVVVAGPAPTAGGWLLCTTWVPGTAIAEAAVRQWSAAQAQSFGADFGRWLRGLHSIRAGHRRWLGPAQARFVAKVRDCRDRGLIDDATVGRLERFWRTVEPALAAAPVALIHRDLQPGNVIVDGAALTGVIDLEQCRLADPLYDLVKPSDRILPLHPGIAPACREAYGFDGTDPAVRRRLDVVFALEYLSALVYFDKHGDRTEQADRHRRLLSLLAGERVAGW